MPSHGSRVKLARAWIANSRGLTRWDAPAPKKEPGQRRLPSGVKQRRDWRERVRLEKGKRVIRPRKARSARNAYTGAHWRQERELLKTLRRALWEQRESLSKL